ncbi:tetratricopeptide repeat protein [Aeromonas simiae]|uniref:tetratricopeptide repeat protein n=1 Tax=Aeromonas simiae TaxID=218936 RepID=UPI0005AB6B05|nr:tetratricopeptide repeat protein [Aeromonas simiae]MDO2949924.1 tetratricopeptide repeat protein [Aeromonas simiae]MDO2954016.1 tetratricopeptide repeat protein [Aeromonas simiae]MDO2957299.1 tetratricopeptide repeat protein [Aeromonas simiae]
MSVINQMLKDLDARQGGPGATARYQPPARQPLWLWLLISLTCLGALALLGWRSWGYWQHGKSIQSASVVTAPAPTPPSEQAESVDALVALPVPDERRQAEAASSKTQAEPAATQSQSEPADEKVEDEVVVPPGEDPEHYYARLDAALQPERQEEDALAAEMVPPTPATKKVKPKNQLSIQPVELSAAQRSELAERRAATALARGDLQEAERQYGDLLSEQPDHVEARKQLAALLYGQERYEEAQKSLLEGLRVHPAQADFRLLLARMAIAQQQPLQALDWLAGARPSIAQNLDYYATWAALAQDAGHTAEARQLYLDLLHQRPDEGRWWLGLGIAEETLGNTAQALEAYRNAQLHGGLGEASNNWLAQRIAALSPHG